MVKEVFFGVEKEVNIVKEVNKGKEVNFWWELSKGKEVNEVKRRLTR